MLVIHFNHTNYLTLPPVPTVLMDYTLNPVSCPFDITEPHFTFLPLNKTNNYQESFSDPTYAIICF